MNFRSENKVHNVKTTNPHHQLPCECNSMPNQLKLRRKTGHRIKASKLLTENLIQYRNQI
uniref:Bm1328, isoform b n=1 Tax=Brugia malayi TaxID=6279 RepID=A0A1I9G2G9_BRUMA|nr:Bm1328, isoform b [Brugia malayi]